MLIRVWLMHTSLVPLNADEGVTGLQAYEVLRGNFRLIVAGNDYGSTTETYLIAPFLAFWSGVWPLRIVPTALSAVAAYALYRLARPIFGRVPAAALALIGWTTSGAVAILFLRPYMGYTSGFIALVAALALACHAMRTERRLARTAGFAGFAAGFAMWSHPIFGTVALLALIAPTLYRRRALRRWWLPLAAGGVLGVSPWLLFIAQNGLPESATPVVDTTYPERVARFVTELLPRAFGLRTELGGDWVGPDAVAVGVAALLIIGSIVGMVVLVIRKGAQALPILVAGVLAFPVLALYAPLGSIADGAVRPAVPAGAADGVGGVAAADPRADPRLAVAAGHRADGLGALAVRSRGASAGRLGVDRPRRRRQADGQRAGRPGRSTTSPATTGARTWSTTSAPGGSRRRFTSPSGSTRRTPPSTPPTLRRSRTCTKTVRPRTCGCRRTATR